MAATLFQRVARDICFTFIVGGTADLVCQRFEHHILPSPENDRSLRDGDRKHNGFSFDLRRTLAFSIFTGLYIGGACNAIYKVYPRVAQWISKGKPPSDRTVGLVSTVLDNFVHVPTMYLPIFYMSTNLMQGHNVEMAKQSLASNYIASLVSCWGFWVPAQFLIFSAVPAVHRVKCVAIGDFLWNVALSYISHRELDIHTRGVNQEQLPLKRKVSVYGTA